MHEHPSGLDSDPPWKRIEVILRLDDFVEIEQLADLIDRCAVIAHIFIGHDDLVGVADVDGRPDDIDCPREAAMPRTGCDMPADPPKDAAVLLEKPPPPTVHDDNFAPRPTDP